MSPRFNADEILEMAIEIESNGEKFYRKAAGLRGDKAARDYLLGLADMETEHRKTFRGMQAALRKADLPSAFDPYDEGALYLDAVADAHGGEGTPAAADLLTPAMPLDSILSTAVEMEKKSILFYLGLRSMVPSEGDQANVDRIIREEKAHIVTLTAKLREVRGRNA